MTPVELSRTVLRAVRRAVDGGELGVSVPVSAAVTPPGPGGCGDFATNIALRLAGPAGRPASEVAAILRPYIERDPGVADVTVTGPGFLNITLARGAHAGLVETVLEQGPRYGYGDALAGQVVELRVPHDTRAETVADALVRIVATQGGHAEVRHAEPVNLRPVPAPEDPAPLGHDAARWALLHPAPHDRPRIGADHLLQRESNPLFRVRYAHARTRALSRNAAALGYGGDPRAVRSPDVRQPDHDRSGVPAGAGAPVGTGARPRRDEGPLRTSVPVLADPTPAPGEADLLAALAEYPHALRQSARHRAPDRLARHLVVTADAVLGFQYVVLPLGDEKPSAAHRARLALAEAAGAVLAGGLSLLGISAPQYL
ncbi:ArgS-related anticodon-binding protein NrtL [Streptomyces sp. NPDC058751]|uniref:ArgS-related anticodon-binding protein NrtL n=1 Tax=Streptomyces sp. NPDC058751 TaxID=3346623 RepID=UPI0036B0EEC4